MTNKNNDIETVENCDINLESCSFAELKIIELLMKINTNIEKLYAQCASGEKGE